jgi:hypothetical protein
LAPKLDLCPGVVKVQEPTLVQAFKANPSIDAFDEGIVRGFAGSAEVQDDTVRIGPQVGFPRGELAAVVHPDASRFAERGDGLKRFGIRNVRLRLRRGRTGKSRVMMV